MKKIKFTNIEWDMIDESARQAFEEIKPPSCIVIEANDEFDPYTWGADHLSTKYGCKVLSLDIEPEL